MSYTYYSVAHLLLVCQCGKPEAVLQTKQAQTYIAVVKQAIIELAI